LVLKVRKTVLKINAAVVFSVMYCHDELQAMHSCNALARYTPLPLSHAGGSVIYGNTCLLRYLELLQKAMALFEIIRLAAIALASSALSC
jgi:hypothetical protein